MGNTWTRQRFLTERPARKGAVGAGAGEHFRFGRASPGGIGAVPVSMDPAFLSPRCGFLKSEPGIVAAAAEFVPERTPGAFLCGRGTRGGRRRCLGGPLAHQDLAGRRIVQQKVYWLDYDPVALAALVMGIGMILLLALSI